MALIELSDDSGNTNNLSIDNYKVLTTPV